MLLLSISAFLLAIFYLLLMNHYWRGWKALPVWRLPEAFQAQTPIDVIIPARNEAANLRSCLRSVLENDYPKSLFQVWLVDDFSTDETAEIVLELQQQYPNLHLISMADFEGEMTGVAFKKQAIAKAISLTSAPLIVCTDADCTVPTKWLANFAAFFAKRQTVMVTAPVTFTREKTALDRFQVLDVMGMMLITGSGIQQNWMRMANGANLAYLRSAFAKVDGFEGIDDMASGDDMLLMQKMAAAFPGKVDYLKSREMVVTTAPEPNYSAFLRQRIRWASKSGRYQERKVTLALLLVFLFTWTIIISLLLILWQPVWAGSLFLLLFLLKSGTDYYLLSQAAQFFGRKSSLQYYGISQLHHIAYIAIVGLLANLRKRYTWKGRRVY